MKLRINPRLLLSFAVVFALGASIVMTINNTFLAQTITNTSRIEGCPPPPPCAIKANCKYGKAEIDENGCEIGCGKVIECEDDEHPSAPVECYDSDGGVDIYKQGTIKLTKDGKTEVATDNCTSDVSDDPTSSRYVDGYDCDVGTDCYVHEFSCKTFDREGDHSKPFPCPHGCSNGACLRGSQGDPGGMDDCLDGLNNYWDQETNMCYGDYSTDIVPKRCSDPDGGRNYHVDAHTFGFRGYSTAANPSRDLRIRTGGRDSCLPDGRLVEHYCDEEGFINTEYYKCPNGCPNGGRACNRGSDDEPEPPEFPRYCKDYDGGRNYEEAGIVRYSTGDGGDNEARDRCMDYKNLFEGTCEGRGDKLYMPITHHCKGRCEDGACVYEDIEEPEYNGFAYMKLECQDGKRFEDDGCKPASRWEVIADEACRGRCHYSGKCGIAHYSIHKECYLDETYLTPDYNPIYDQPIPEPYPPQIEHPEFPPPLVPIPVPEVPSFYDFEVKEQEFEDEVRTREAPESRFSDIANDNYIGKAANELAEMGIIGGYPDGTFRSEKSVNRAEAAKFLMLARFGRIPEMEGDGGFWDIMPGEWYVKYVILAARQGVISGYPDRSFKPANTVNTAEFLKMITLTFGLERNMKHSFVDVSVSDWFDEFVGVADYYKIFPERGNRLEPDRLLTRGEVATAIFTIMKSM